MGQLSPCATTYWTRVPQLEKPPQLESSPCSLQQETACTQCWRPSRAKEINKWGKSIPCISGPSKFKPVLFKCQLHIGLNQIRVSQGAGWERDLPWPVVITSQGPKQEEQMIIRANSNTLSQNLRNHWELKTVHLPIIERLARGSWLWFLFLLYMFTRIVFLVDDASWDYLPIWGLMQSHYDFCRRPLRFPLLYRVILQGAFQVAPVVKNPPANAGDTRDVSLIPESGRSPGGGNGNPLQYSRLENPTDRGAWQAVVHGVTKSWTWLSNLVNI